jgi:hypothetical protein
MDELSGFEICRDLANYRPSGSINLSEAAALVTHAISRAREAQVRKLLVNLSGWTSLSIPSVADRFFYIQEWALASRGLLRLAVVAPPEMIDPQKFGVAVARNRGLIAEVFVSEKEALSWLGVTVPT